LIVVSLTAIAILYFPLAFYFFCDKEIKRQNLALSIISGFFLSIIPIGLAFKLQYWPGAQTYLLIGVLTSPIILGTVYVFRERAPADLNIYYGNMLKRTLLLFILTTVLYFTPNDTLIKIQHWDDPEFARLKIQYFANPGNAEYERQYNDYIIKLDAKDNN
jgi:glucose uptake protein GlcU